MVGIDGIRSSREAVLADAEALLTCYGVGEETGTSDMTHAVVELLFTSSIRFLQPGLLLKVRMRGREANALFQGTAKPVLSKGVYILLPCGVCCSAEYHLACLGSPSCILAVVVPRRV